MERDLPTHANKVTCHSCSDIKGTPHSCWWVHVSCRKTYYSGSDGHKTLVWSAVASLPHPYSYTSETICGDQLYVLGGMDDKGRTKSVLTCSLTE